MFRALFLTLSLLLTLARPDAAIAQGVVEPLSDGASLTLPTFLSIVPSPQDYLGYRLGNRFTHHERMVSYFEAVYDKSERMSIRQYGSTYEGRPLYLMAFSHPDNIARLDDIQKRHLKLANPEAHDPAEIADIVANDPVVVWLGYGVHGNESSSAEAALLTTYVLAGGAVGWGEFLKDVVILIDPLVNPDGRERYVHFFETHRGKKADPSMLASEHWEPWPGGRQNHYLVDLNRDWAWATQIETRARLATYRLWEPQVFVDFHEMWPDSTYFFPPAADPISPLIPKSTIGWLDTFGKSNAEAFDAQGWTFYVGQHFDLFYPGYGDSYPGLRGAVGMTYEMAGHGIAGSAVERSDGEILTLADRLARHYTTSMATIRAAVANRSELLRDFAASRRAAIAEPARTYLWDEHEFDAHTAAILLESHGVVVELLDAPRTLTATPHSGGAAVSREFPAGTFLASTRQPLGSIVRALMEPDVPMDEAFIATQRERLEKNQRPEFYDITAWSLPLAYNFEAWTVDGDVDGAGLHAHNHDSQLSGEGELGYLIPPQGLASYNAASYMQEQGIRFRLTIDDLRLAGVDYPAGTLFVPRRGNPDTIDESMVDVGYRARVHRTATGLSENGISLGSNEVVPIRQPAIGIASGRGVSATSFGYIWHLLDQQVGARQHRIALSSLGRIELSDLDVLVLPSGRYGSQLDEKDSERLSAWVRRGGLLVAVGNAVSWVTAQKLVEVETWEVPDADTEKNEVTELTPENRPLYTPGAALATELSASHPLASGLARSPAAIFQGSTVLLPSGNPREDVLVARDENPVLAGFAWPEAEERLEGSLLVGARANGQGAVVLFAQEPSYRLFWRSTAPLFLNAVMYGPSLVERGRLLE